MMPWISKEMSDDRLREIMVTYTHETTTTTKKE
jgi:hypothetical protein